jgi:hypothetical protein
MKRAHLPLILRSYADDMGIAGPQYATMASILRQSADALDVIDHVRSALNYVEGMRLLLAHLKAGTLADPNAIEHELDRTARTLRYVLGEPAGELEKAHQPPVPQCAVPDRAPVLDRDGVPIFGRCENCED